MADLLAAVENGERQVLELLEAHRAAVSGGEGDERLELALARRLVREGFSARAFEVCRASMEKASAGPWPRYYAALALARGGNSTLANTYLQPLLDDIGLEPGCRGEALALAGRLCKDAAESASDDAARKEALRDAARWYGMAFEMTGDPFPGINAATTTLLAGDAKGANVLAARVKALASDRWKDGGSRDYWLAASLGEAALIAGDLKQAADWYGKAARLAAGRWGDLSSMRRNVMLLRSTTDVPPEVLGALSTGAVIAFSGHMIDHPARTAPRFPASPALEQDVRAKIDEALDGLRPIAGYSSAACGSDILFAEALIRRRLELHVILPFDREDFCSTSVDFGYDEMASWRQRFDEVLAAASEVHYATREHFLGDDALFELTGSLTQGLTLARARELGSEPHALTVFDAESTSAVGGTGFFLKRWTDGGRPATVIDLAGLRQRAVSASAAAVWPTPRRAPLQGHVQRQVKAMLFADVKNFSHLREEQAPFFFEHFLPDVADLLLHAQEQPVFRNTWGDGLFLVFDSVVGCASLAMDLLDRVRSIDWDRWDLPADTTLRIGVHAGPVFPEWDPVIDRQNFFGGHVNRAARIEPVTTPGCAFASEQFAALLELETGHPFRCEYIGIEQLAKDYDRCALYRIVRGAPPSTV